MTTIVAKTMSCSSVCWLFPLALGLLLGQPTHGLKFSAPPGPPAQLYHQGFFEKLQKIQAMWQKQQATMIRHALEAQKLVVNYLNRKHNGTYQMVPGETTHIVVETVFGRIVHLTTVLVNATCPETHMMATGVGNRKDCKVLSESPRLLCRLSVIKLLQHDRAYIQDEGCANYTTVPPTPHPPNVVVGSAYPIDEEEEENPYI